MTRPLGDTEPTLDIRNPLALHRCLSSTLPGLWRAEWWIWWNRRSPGGRARRPLHFPIPAYRFSNFRSTQELVIVLRAMQFSKTLFDTLPTEDDLARLLSINDEVETRVRANYSDEEIARRAVGGWVGHKELLIYTLLRHHPVDLVVETGVAQGVSSWVILAALEANGRGALISVDLPNRDPRGYVYNAAGDRDAVFTKDGLEPGWLVPQELRSRWDLRIGPAQTILPTLDVRPELFLHDSLHTYDQMAFELRWAWNRTPVGGFVGADDIGWNRAFQDFVADHRGEITLLCNYGVGMVRRVARNPRDGRSDRRGEPGPG